MIPVLIMLGSGVLVDWCCVGFCWAGVNRPALGSAHISRVLATSPNCTELLSALH